MGIVSGRYRNIRQRRGTRNRSYSGLYCVWVFSDGRRQSTLASVDEGDNEDGEGEGEDTLEMIDSRLSTEVGQPVSMGLPPAYIRHASSESIVQRAPGAAGVDAPEGSPTSPLSPAPTYRSRTSVVGHRALGEGEI